MWVSCKNFYNKIFVSSLYARLALTSTLLNFYHQTLLTDLYFFCKNLSNGYIYQHLKNYHVFESSSINLINNFILEKDFKVIDHFVNLLKGTEEFNKDFAEIKFKNSERIVSRNVEVLTFQVFAKIDQKLIKKMKRKSYS